ncbi:hypothetical protein EVAR_87459_1 [Eumeta japonica]|uniref:Uncharacterized protein n=1 Tax=Eumeta variegata TaxID=151549 RepID=A0A4C1VYZ6_EUMVA|nr:hypothetical protein EVAR_87459_1 [Eumeta japonica]
MGPESECSIKINAENGTPQSEGSGGFVRYQSSHCLDIPYYKRINDDRAPTAHVHRHQFGELRTRHKSGYMSFAVVESSAVVEHANGGCLSTGELCDRIVV